MELSENTPLSLPLFFLDEHIEQRDMAQPDLTMQVILNETLIAHLCQNPKADESISINLADYQITVEQSQHASAIEGEHQAQLILNRGPVLSAVLSLEDNTMFISPPMEMMPTFDLGEEEEI